MRFMILLKANAMSEGGGLPSEALLREMGAYNEALVAAGVMVDGGGLRPTAQGARVRFSGAEREVVRGPFADRTVAGYWIFNADSLDAAIDWVKRCPNPTGDTGEIEIRPFFETEDFAEVDPSGELRAAEHALSERIAAQR